MDSSLLSPARRRGVAIATGCLWLVGRACLPALAADPVAPPVITVQPAGGIVGFGEDFVLQVQATGVAPLKYQWYINGGGIAGATNASLFQTNFVTPYTAAYFVTVANAGGSVTSSNAMLTIQVNPTRRLETGRLLQVGSQVGVPIIFRANGRENAVSFSLAYDTNAYSGPVFTVADPRAAVTLNTTLPGAVGVALALPAGERFPAGYPWLGLLQFNLAAGYGPLQGGLAFATNPVPVTAANTNGLALAIFATVQPQFLLATNQPQLQPQSGLFQDRLLIGNPGAAILTNLDILAYNPGTDSRSNFIAFFNAQAYLTNYPYGDPLLDIPCPCPCGLYVDAATNACAFTDYLLCGNGTCGIDDTSTNLPLPFAQITNLLPGESRWVTLDYLVPDHATVPQPKYILYQDYPRALIMPGNVAQVTITTNRYHNGTFLVEFPTFLGSRYYIQYAASPEGLVTNVQTVFPPLNGTGGHLQWIDNGPPKTASPPVDKARFYRVMKY